MKTSNGVPVRVQKAGEAARVCDHSHDGENIPMSPGKVPSGLSGGQGKSAVEPKVEIREVEPGIFEITVTCRCGERAVVRCESLVADEVKKS